jgi:hypothetical protein
MLVQGEAEQVRCSRNLAPPSSRRGEPGASSLAHPLLESPPMNAAKEEVLRLLDLLPEDASLEDIQYHIYVRQKIDHGLEDVEAGRTLSEEEFDQRMAKWLEP